MTQSISEQDVPLGYLVTLVSLVKKGYVEDSVDRRLTDKGRQAVVPYFSNFDLEHILRCVRVFRHDRKEVVEIDSFLYETANLLSIETTSPDRENIEIEQCRMNIHNGLYVLAAIHVLQEADTASLVEINPRYAPRDENHYLHYNFPLTL